MKQFIQSFLIGVILLVAFSALAGDSSPKMCALPAQKLNEADFLGDKVVLPAQSNTIDRLVFNIDLPRKASWLKTRPSQIIVQSPRQGVLLKTTLKGKKTSIEFGKAIEDEKLDVLAQLYFCTKDKESLCVSRDVLFEIPLIAGMDGVSVNINYKVPKE